MIQRSHRSAISSGGEAASWFTRIRTIDAVIAASSTARVTVGVGTWTETGEVLGLGADAGAKPRLQLNRTGMMTQTKFSRVLKTPGLISSFTSKKTSSFVRARSGSMRKAGLNATCSSGPL